MGKQPSLKKPFERIATDLPLGAVVAPLEVDDPLSLYGEEPDRIIVMRNLRGDPLAWLDAHGGIDEAQYLAGRCWRALYERAEIGSVQALDTSKEPVDGGGIRGEMITDGQRRAIKQLRLAEEAVIASVKGDRLRGVERAKIVRDILGVGMFPKHAAAARGIYDEYGIRQISNEFKRGLDALATSFEWQNVYVYNF